MDSLVTMQSFLRGRPSTFKSLEEAIEWRYAVICTSSVAKPWHTQHMAKQL